MTTGDSWASSPVLTADTHRMSLVKLTIRGPGVGALLCVILGCFGAAGQVADQALPKTVAAAWNRTARDFVRSDGLSPPRAARVYAYLSVAQHRALIAVRRHSRWRVAEAEEGLLNRRAISTASKVVLESLFPRQLGKLVEAYNELEARWYSGERQPDEFLDNLADMLGQRAASSVLHRAEHDGAASQKPFTLPQAVGIWRSLSGSPPVEPMWGEVRPLGIASTDDISPEKPPKVNSAEFRKALEVVKRMASNAGREELSSVLEWADGPGTTTPPGHWNAIAEGMADRYNLDEDRTVELFALLNIALFDASIVCWRVKYRYLYPRPSQIDPTLPTHLAVPNFPSFTSGHATFSSAASTILAFFLPAESDELDQLASSAALSRVYAGIHYPFDTEVGSRQGRAIARHVLSRYINQSDDFYDDF